MPRIFLYAMHAITTTFFIIAIVFVVSSFGPSTWQGTSLSTILDSLKNVFSALLYLGMGAGSYIDRIFTSNAYVVPLSPIMETLYFQFLNVSFRLTDINGNPVPFYSFYHMIHGSSPFGNTPSIFTLLADQSLRFATNFYFLLMILLVIAACVYLLLFVARSDIKYSLYTTISLIFLFITALFPSLIRYMLYMFNVPTSFYSSFFNTYLPSMPITNQDTTAKMLTGGAFWSAFFMYSCAELSFQTAYVAKVTQPSIERERRLRSQVSILGEKSLEFEIEKQKEIKEQRVAIESGTKKEEEEKKRVTLKSFFTGGGFGAIREMISTRERERERERLEEVSSDTRRLNSYISRLFEIDKSARESLTAIGSRPSEANMVSSTFLNMGLRLSALLGLTILVANPLWLYMVFNVPPVIAQSYSITTPEAVITSLVPIALLFPVVAFIIRTYKRIKLTRFKAQREEESAMLKKISELQEMEEEETIAPEQDQKIPPEKP
ncbi:MAG TPA: hypothetical protein VKM55_14100 [Candidatus Lokiarchaeia archaeon]|nr:hypothetical protein [Candidatus Lokiarchaeia archaeon]